MPARNQAALDFLLSRRSLPARTIRPPVPDRADLTEILTAAVRVPDHGKLEPWRFVVIERAAMTRLAGLAEARAKALGGDDDKIAKGRGQYDLGHLAVVVIASPSQAAKVPLTEQMLSAGALCLGVVNAAGAAGWAACWLTGWPAHDAAFTADAFGTTPGETVAGIIHIGTSTVVPPDRPRPDPARLTTWISA